MTLHKDRFRYVISVLIYLLSYIVAYLKIAVGSFKYFGFGDGDFSYINQIIIFTCIAIPACLMPLGSKKPSVYVNNILFFMVYIPIVVIVNDKNIAYEIENIWFSFVVLFCFLTQFIFA